MKTGKTLFLILAALPVLFSCKVDDALQVPLVELGLPQREYLAPAAASEVDLQVWANGKYDVIIEEGADWIRSDEKSGSGDGEFTVSVEANSGFRRSGRVFVVSAVGDRADTLSIKQEGIEAKLTAANTSIDVHGAGGSHSVALATNVPDDRIACVTAYPEDAPEWIRSARISEGTLSVDADPNTASTPRNATLILSFTDGWGDEKAVVFNVVQRNAAEEFGRVISYSELKGDYAADGRPVTDYVLIEGIIVSDPASGNVASNEQTTTTNIDYNGTKKAAYLESYDGVGGVYLKCATVDDNIFRRYDKVRILLTGTVPTLKNDPDRIEISGVAASMVVSREEGTASDVPVKEKSISELTDSDLYTFVTLKDVEFAVRKGSLVPINEGYSVGALSNRFNAFPRLLLDRDGQSIYLVTNTVCSFRNEGTRLPYGSGKLSGVIVHERFPRFAWKEGADPVDVEDDPSLGRLGTYQIRPQTKEDIWSGMKDNFEDGFAAMLTEYRFWNPDPDAGVLRPTYGDNGWFTHTYAGYTEATWGQRMTTRNSYSYLGPIGRKDGNMFGVHMGNVNGCGIVLDPAKDRWNAAMSGFVGTNADGSKEWCGATAVETGAKNINSDGNCTVQGAAYQVWKNDNWFSADGRPHAWMMKVSTAGISTDHISLQLATFNDNYFTPRFWKAQWAVTDSMTEGDDEEWHTFGEYMVPDLSKDTKTLTFTTSGTKHINLPMPLEVLGKSDLYIRLIPASDACSDGDCYSAAKCADATSGTHGNMIEYIAIRYNK